MLKAVKQLHIKGFLAVDTNLFIPFVLHVAFSLSHFVGEIPSPLGGTFCKLL